MSSRVRLLLADVSNMRVWIGSPAFRLLESFYRQQCVNAEWAKTHPIPQKVPKWRQAMEMMKHLHTVGYKGLYMLQVSRDKRHATWRKSLGNPYFACKYGFLPKKRATSPKPRTGRYGDENIYRAVEAARNGVVPKKQPVRVGIWSS